MHSVAAVFGLLLLAADTKTIEEHFADGAIKRMCEVRIAADETEIEHGRDTSYFPGGQPQRELYWVDGKKDGPWTEWYPSGEKSVEGWYLDDLKDGIETAYFPQGG